jgi:hypothetical protein
MAASRFSRAHTVLLRTVLALVSPFVIMAQLIHLWWHLRARTGIRSSAQEKARAFGRLICELHQLAEPWRARFLRKSERWSGRGIVVVAGGPRYSALASQLVESLRSVGCMLPIEIFHLGAAELDCDECRALGELEGVSLRDLLSGQPTLLEQEGYGYAAKAFALIASSFSEVLLLDADNRVVADPTGLFDSAPFQERGALFWCDMYAASETFVRLYDPFGVRARPSRVDQLVQDLLDRWLVTPVRAKPDFNGTLADIGLAPSGATQESGQLVIDKPRCLGALAALSILNSNTHRPLVYSGLHGDKDTFRIAFAALGAPFHMINERPALGGQLDAHGVLFDSCFVQPGLDGKPLFLHYCGRHRHDDEQRTEEAPPESYMTHIGRPFKLWPYDGRRGYMGGRVRSFAAGLAAGAPSVAG